MQKPQKRKRQQPWRQKNPQRTFPHQVLQHVYVLISAKELKRICQGVETYRDGNLVLWRELSPNGFSDSRGQQSCMYSTQKSRSCEHRRIRQYESPQRFYGQKQPSPGKAHKPSSARPPPIGISSANKKIL